MPRNATPQKQLLAVTIASLFTSSFAFAQATPPADDNTIVVTGTRVPNRTVLDTAAPVDVIPASALRNTGVTETSQALSVALPSLNFPRPGLADGTDTVRPVTLRGLGPDQSLVLVNSKRRHTGALINLNGTVGRGSASVDLNSIPVGIIRNVEVLRDGASAQYGSDAIAGVVNMRLRTDRTGGEATVSYGGRLTEYDFIPGTVPAGGTWAPPSGNKRERADGQTGTVNLWKGLALGETGHLTIAAEYKKQAHTERSGWDFRQLYDRVGTNFDPRENTINRFDAWYGEPEIEQSTIFANAGSDMGNGVKLYGWASYQRRDARSAGNFRQPNNANNILSIYPDGFLPIIAPTVDDYSMTGGVSWSLGDWEMDTSLGYGHNKMHFTIENSLNRSIGPTSKTVFDAGGFAYDQLVFNLSGVRAFDTGGSPLNVAVGAEARREGFSMTAGEPDSYRQGGVRTASGAIAPPGAQVFPGFQPSDAADNSRTAIGAYIDVETNLTKQLLVSGAVRAERYSDFGSNATGKLAGRFDFNKSFALRGSVQNGFRAPSPQQLYFTSTATNFINGVPLEIKTFRPTDAVAAALGAKPLDAEKSVNLSLGTVIRSGKMSLTIDAYRIEIEDRIVLSENLGSTAAQQNVRDYLAARGFAGIGGARFFINGVDTTTRGLDVVLNYSWAATDMGRFDFTMAANHNKTSVTKVPTTAQLAALNPAPTLFSRVEVLRFERGQPSDKLSASLEWTQGPFGATARATRYGEVLDPGTTAALDQVLSPKTLVDIEARYELNKNLRFAIGAENVFDKYPDARPPALNTNGAVSYSNFSPFGRSGRYVYGRLSYAF